MYEIEKCRKPVDLVKLTGQRCRQVKPETVDMHLGDPVPERIHDQLQRVWVLHAEAVAGACGVVIKLRVVGDEPVVRGVVYAAEAESRPEVVALRGVVVDDVEDDFDARFVQRADHGLELVDLLASLAAACVTVMRRKESDRVVSPVVAERHVEQSLVLNKLVDRHELDSRDAQRLKVLDHGRMRKTGIRAAQLFLHIWMTASHSLHVRFIDDRFVQWGFGGPVIAPLEIRVVHHRSENVRSAVGGVDGALVAELVRVAGWVPPDLSFYCAGVWIQQKLAWVAPGASLGRIWTSDAVPIALAGLDVGHVGVPRERVDLLQGHSTFLSLVVEQTEVDRLGDLAVQSKVRSGAVEVGA